MTICVSNTYPDWIASIRNQTIEGPVNFWRKDKRKLHLEPGAFIYFKLGRRIVGRGAFVEQSSMSLDDAWRRFRTRNGADSHDQFEERAVKALGIVRDAPLNCLILENLELLEGPSYPEISEADFSRFIQAHKFFKDDALDLAKYFGHGDDTDVLADLKSIMDDPKLTKTQRDTLIKARIGQGAFRADVLAAFQGKCAVTGCATPEVIRASHIKPWSKSTNRERLDACNGLPLVANLDALFDRHMITFAANGRLQISRTLSNEDAKLLGVADAVQLEFDAARNSYMRHHRERFEDLEQSPSRIGRPSGESLPSADPSSV